MFEPPSYHGHFIRHTNKPTHTHTHAPRTQTCTLIPDTPVDEGNMGLHLVKLSICPVASKLFLCSQFIIIDAKY